MIIHSGDKLNIMVTSASDTHMKLLSIKYTVGKSLRMECVPVAAAELLPYDNTLRKKGAVGFVSYDNTQWGRVAEGLVPYDNTQ